MCIDKIGTLTEAHIRLELHLDPLRRDSALLLELTYLNCHFQAGRKTPLDEAILRHQEVDVRGWAKVDELPFDFERCRVSVLAVRDGSPPLLVVKGALEDIIRLSARYEADGPTDLRALDDAARRTVTARFEALG